MYNYIWEIVVLVINNYFRIKNVKKYNLFLLITTQILFCTTTLFAEADDIRQPTIILHSKSKTKTHKKNPTLSFFYGGSFNVHNNVFNSPMNVVGSKFYGTLKDLEKTDYFFTYTASVDVKGKLFKDDYRIQYQYEGINYTSYTILNKSTHELDLDYSHKFSNSFTFKTAVDMYVEDKKATTILGNELTQKYSNTYMSIEPMISYKIIPKTKTSVFRTTEIRISYELSQKDYQESAPTLSLDYFQQGINLDIIQDIGKNIGIKLEYDQLYKKYANDLANEPNGDYNIIGLKREQNYTSVSLNGDLKFHKTNTELRYSYNTRIDLYKDYYTYSANVISAKFGYQLNDETSITAELEYELRDYKVQTAPVVGPNPKLSKKYTDVSLLFIRQLFDNLDLYIAYILGNRDTNKYIKHRFPWTFLNQ